jgi:D-alanyl-D-alanine carboxypeptidase (penicillin-binding protein 5/6)
VNAYGERRRGRWIVVLLGVILIVAPVLYGTLTLISPLPPTRTVQTGFTKPTAFDPVALTLPQGGASAVVGPDGTVLATAGSPNPVPMAGAAKTILVLASLEARPLADEDGENIAITAADVRFFRDLAGTGARVSRVTQGSTWTQRQLIRAVLVGGSNNHARTLARWAFGSEDAYVAAANTWVADNGLPDTTVVDATGLPAENVATAADLARLAWLAGGTPEVKSIVSGEDPTRPGGNVVNDNLSYRDDTGITAFTRGYTDAAGVCLLFSLPLAAEGEDAGAMYGALLGQPDYDALSSSLDAVLADAAEAVVPVTIIEEGDEVARIESEWGQSASLVAARTVSVLGFAGELPAGTIEVPKMAFVANDRPVGDLMLPLGDGTERIGLRSVGSIRDPGLVWRVTHPAELLSNLLGS